MVETSEYKMRPGEYVEDKNIESLAEKHLEGNPIINDYEWRVIDNGDKKNTFGFGIEYVDPTEALEEHDTEVFDDAISRTNDFVEAVTGRDAKMRADDMD